jgi:hypothetical protein
MIVTKLARYALTVSTFFWMACAMPATAQQPTPTAIATAKELLTVKGATSMFDPLIPGMIESTKNAILPSNPTLFRDLNEISGRLRTEFSPRRDQIIDEIARIYAQKFTEPEMKEVIAFYKTPVGKKFVNEEPALIDQGLSRAEAWSQRMSEEVMNRFRAELKKKGHDL